MIARVSETHFSAPVQGGVGAVPHEYLQRVLRPYLPTGTDYLRSASIAKVPAPERLAKEDPFMVAEGRFCIPSSCYIQSTGHFNAVEFLICFNQLAYTSLGYGVTHGLFAGLAESWGSETTRAKLDTVTEKVFFDNQLSSMLILKAETRFQKFIDAADFRATLSIQSMFTRRDTVFVETECRFSDDRGGKAEGNVLLAYASIANGT